MISTVRLMLCCDFCTTAKYFSMSRKQCKESLELYKKFVVRMELVAKFLAVAEVSFLITEEMQSFCAAYHYHSQSAAWMASAFGMSATQPILG